MLMGKIILVLVSSLVLFICKINADDSSKIICDGNNQFTLDLYKALVKQEQKDANIIYSPFSAHAALAMLYEGSGGTTETLLKNVLHLPDKNVTASGYNAIINHLDQQENIRLSIADKIFVQKGCALKESFNNVLKEKYNSESGVLDFGQKADAALAINSWVENKTESKLKDLFVADDFETETNLVLVNSVYFKGEWNIPFSEILTRKKKFYVSSEKVVEVPMMVEHNLYKMNLANELGAKILELPFENENFSMIVILPDALNGIQELEAKLGSMNFTEIVNNLGYALATIWIPKFKLEQKIDMETVLKEIGLGELFDKEKCDLSQMVENRELVISKAVQKVCINVNEKGCEAAAATGMKASPRSLGFEFLADHPFLFAIIEKLEGHVSVLFAGKVSDPSIL